MTTRRIVIFRNREAFSEISPKTFAKLTASCCALLLLAGAVFSGCSSSGSKTSKNTISPYDPAFDPDEDGDKKDGPSLTAREQMQQTQEALNFYDNELYTAARDALAELQRQYPSSYYAVLVELKLADANYNLGEYPVAIELYEEFIRLRPNHEAAPYARLQIGNSFFAQYRGVVFDQSPLTQAEKHFTQVQKEYSGSVAERQAIEMLVQCQNLRLAHQRYVAGFYRGQGLDEASMNRIKNLLAELNAMQAEQLLEEMSGNLGEDQLRELREAAAMFRSDSGRSDIGHKGPAGSLSAKSLAKLESYRKQIVLESSQQPDSGRSSTTDTSVAGRVQIDGSELSFSCFQTSHGILAEFLLPQGIQETIEPRYQPTREWLLKLPTDRGPNSQPYFFSTSSDTNDRCNELGLAIDIARINENSLLSIRSNSDLGEPLFLPIDRPSRLLVFYSTSRPSDNFEF